MVLNFRSVFQGLSLTQRFQQEKTKGNRSRAESTVVAISALRGRVVVAHG